MRLGSVIVCDDVIVGRDPDMPNGKDEHLCLVAATPSTSEKDDEDHSFDDMYIELEPFEAVEEPEERGQTPAAGLCSMSDQVRDLISLQVDQLFCRRMTRTVRKTVKCAAACPKSMTEPLKPYAILGHR